MRAPGADSGTRAQRSSRERILEAACDLIAEEGVDNVRIARIAARAGVSTTLVHHRFRTRDALLAEALGHSFELLEEGRVAPGGAGGPAASALADAIDQSLPRPGVAERDWKLWLELWLQAARHPELRAVAVAFYARYRDWMADVIAAGVATGELATDDPRAVADRLIGLIDGLGMRVLLGDPTMSRQRAEAEVWALASRELGPA